MLLHMILTLPEILVFQLICLGISDWSFRTLFRHHVLLEAFCNTLTTLLLAEQITFNSVLICTYFIPFSVFILFIYIHDLKKKKKLTKCLWAGPALSQSSPHSNGMQLADSQFLLLPVH